MGSSMWRTREIGECYIPGNVPKHSRECLQTIWGMSQTFLGMLLNIPGEYSQTF